MKSRRDLLKVAALAIPAAAIKLSLPEHGARPGPRVVWFTECLPVGHSNRTWDTAEQVARKQIALGRRVVQVIDRCGFSVVVIEEDFGSDQAAMDFVFDFHKHCDEVGNKYHNLGEVSGISYLAAGQVFDVLQFVDLKDRTQIKKLRSDMRQLDLKVNGKRSFLIG